MGTTGNRPAMMSPSRRKPGSGAALAVCAPALELARSEGAAAERERIRQADRRSPVVT
jgi:hypothetical protein